MTARRASSSSRGEPELLMISTFSALPLVLTNTRNCTTPSSPMRRDAGGYLALGASMYSMPEVICFGSGGPGGDAGAVAAGGDGSAGCGGVGGALIAVGAGACVIGIGGGGETDFLTMWTSLGSAGGALGGAASDARSGVMKV